MNFSGFIGLLNNSDIKMKAYQVDNSHPRPHAPHEPPTLQAPSSPASTTSHALHSLKRKRPYRPLHQISTQEREPLLLEGRCAYCQGIGYMFSTCPAKSRRVPGACPTFCISTAATIAAAAPAFTTEEDLLGPIVPATSVPPAGNA